MKATNARGNSVASAASAAVTPLSCATGGVCVVGDTGPGGGKVFYVLGGSETVPGAACGSGCRYLEAAPAGWDSGGGSDPNLPWGGGSGAEGQCSNKTISGAEGTAIGSGFANTAAIMAACPDSNGPNSAPAALAASTYAPTVNGVAVTGWFLPTTREYYQLDVSAVGGLTPGDIYWSSSYVNPLQAWAQLVGAGGGSAWSSKYSAYKVRPVRAC